jgi:hypothetical protein
VVRVPPCSSGQWMARSFAAETLPIFSGSGTKDSHVNKYQTLIIFKGRTV